MGSAARTRPARRRWRIAVVPIALATIGSFLAPVSAAPPSPSVITADPSEQLHDRFTLAELPAPPTAPSTDAGSCTHTINPHDTGCLRPAWGALGAVGAYYPSSDYMLIGAQFAGAPTSGPTSGYTGSQVLLVHTDGKTFPNGDPWKCLTCGVAYPANFGSASGNNTFTYPINGFHDGKRALAGSAVIDCGSYQFADPRCTPAQLRAYPLYWDNGTGKPGQLREARLNPDDRHIGFSYLITSATQFDEYSFAGTLGFDPANSRYDIGGVRVLYNPAPAYQPYTVESGNRLRFNPAGMIGEFRGWTADGRSALGIQSYESDNIDAWATDNVTGRSRLLTRHAMYTDPMAASPDGRHLLSEQLLGSGRMDFLGGMQGVPPLTDQAGTTGHVSGLHDNVNRRFFLPHLVDPTTGRSEQLEPDGNWNTAADPAWLADSSAAVWAENLACGANPTPHTCADSTEPGGRNSRVMIARFPGFGPTPPPSVPTAPDTTWGLPYQPGQAIPARPHLAAGSYTVRGSASGTAEVVVTENSSKSLVMTLAVTYSDFSDTPGVVLNGTESVVRESDSAISAMTLHENLRMTGRHRGTKQTSEPNGFTMSPALLQSNFQVTGTLTITIDGHTYTQPANGT
ncbi:hypothetical protein [Nocardia macrotermitis]|uniref:Uncharacterized protein n=1 Tax=Nocardia macrotermitis TaxID=2585198 RepID=A0A7K0D6S4_9NOCA|nr:hypothetical protein [Nocardia macrotermitis]MQY21455.1 hypothetical protein [Nocardia macrotermitis]